MVEEVIKRGKKLFQCETCEFLYADKKWAQKCEAWCNEHKTCSLEITKHAVEEK